jgi:hypothetical protein
MYKEYLLLGDVRIAMRNETEMLISVCNEAEPFGVIWEWTQST